LRGKVSEFNGRHKDDPEGQLKNEVNTDTVPHFVNNDITCSRQYDDYFLADNW